MSKIRLEPIAFESLGVRGMCTYVETPDVKVLIDAGASLGLRHGLLPHPREYQALERARRRIRERALASEVVTVSHYHYDHYTPAWREREWVLTWSCAEEAEAIYAGKKVLLKDVRTKINLSQRKRGWLFEKAVSTMTNEVEVADGREFVFNETKLRFSPPVPHGEGGSGLGYVLMLCIKHEDERVVHTSDVQGPMSEEALTWIIAQRPSAVLVGGPPIYLEEGRVNRASIEKGLQNLVRLIEEVPLVVVDHHAARLANWRERLSKWLPSLEEGRAFISAAELAGVKEELLEAMRRRLYEEEPPSEEFVKWARLRREERRRIPPPLA